MYASDLLGLILDNLKTDELKPLDVSKLLLEMYPFSLEACEAQI